MTRLLLPHGAPLPSTCTLALGCSLLLSCAGQTRAEPGHAPPTRAPGPAPGGAAPITAAPWATSAPPAKNPATPVAETPPSPAFPPKDIIPPHARSAAPDDGRWAPFGNAALGERAATDPPAVVRTVVHPHPDSKWVTITIAAVDLTRVAVRLVPGTEDLEWAKVAASAPAGLVPAADRGGLIAVANGGFQPKHGRWGMMASSVVIAPPREDGCTIALYPDGSVRLGPWPALAPTRDRMESFRQTPACLVAGGALHPALLAGHDKQWAGHAADVTTRRRSGIGLDLAGRVLFYAVGEEADPRWLAEGLRLAGAEGAAELDINWYWTRFLLFGEGEAAGGSLHVTSTLIPKMEHLATSYVQRPSTRDFFYLVRRR